MICKYSSTLKIFLYILKNCPKSYVNNSQLDFCFKIFEKIIDNKVSHIVFSFSNRTIYHTKQCLLLDLCKYIGYDFSNIKFAKQSTVVKYIRPY